MSRDRRTFRPLAGRSLCSCLAGVLLCAAPLPLCAQALHAVEQDGRIVWTNDGPALPAPRAAEKKVQASATRVKAEPHTYYYWSNVEQRWKPIRPASAAAVRSAQAAASEVSSYIESQPALEATVSRAVSRKLATRNPNYAVAAEGRQVSAPQIDRTIDEAAARHHVDPNLVRALVKVESNYNPRAVSGKGAMGLMQLMPATARMYDVRNPFDAEQNVDAGVRHLKGLLDSYGGDVRLSLAAYNAGQGAVARSGGIPPYAETQSYVRRITSLMGGAPQAHLNGFSAPIELRRDERGRLIITNTE